MTCYMIVSQKTDKVCSVPNAIFKFKKLKNYIYFQFSADIYLDKTMYGKDKLISIIHLKY